MLIKFPSWAVTFAFPVYLSALEYVTIELYTGFIFGGGFDLANPTW